MWCKNAKKVLIKKSDGKKCLHQKWNSKMLACSRRQQGIFLILSNKSDKFFINFLVVSIIFTAGLPSCRSSLARWILNIDANIFQLQHMEDKISGLENLVDLKETQLAAVLPQVKTKTSKCKQTTKNKKHKKKQREPAGSASVDGNFHQK